MTALYEHIFVVFSYYNSHYHVFKFLFYKKLLKFFIALFENGNLI